LETYQLIPHPQHSPHGVSAIEARIVALDRHWLSLRWKVTGTDRLVLPAFAGRGRADGLWRTTCFELFVRSGAGEGYAEFNLSPSERWAAYDFTGYRDGMSERLCPRDPVCSPRGGRTVLIFDTAIPAAALPPLPWHYGLSAVIEEEGGHMSFWAIAHPPGPPDFHSPACFAAQLAAPEAS
jgi:hypothetical protein